MHDDRPTDPGETLIEILMTIAILGISVLAVLAALFTAISASAFHRQQADADVAAKAYAEALRLYVGQLTSPGWCQPGGYALPASSYTLPSDFGTGTVTVNPGDWGPCPAKRVDQVVNTPQFQTATVTATTASGVVAKQAIVLTPSWCYNSSAVTC